MPVSALPRRVAVAGLVALLGMSVPSLRAAVPETCLVTLANDRPFAEPSPSNHARFWYGSEKLAVLLARGGVWRGMGPNRGYRDKLFWWREGYRGDTEGSPDLRITGRRLDGDSPRFTIRGATNAHHLDFGGWAMLRAVEFPSGGCWELTGEYRGQSLSFVVYVDGR